MKKANNLAELIELVGIESVEKCFMEYMELVIAKAKKYDELNIKRHPYKWYVYQAEFVLSKKQKPIELAEQISESIATLPLLSNVEIWVGKLDVYLGDNRRCIKISFSTNIDIDEFNLYDKLRKALFDNCKALKGITVGDSIEEEEVTRYSNFS